jgi:hypothetical protein
VAHACNPKRPNTKKGWWVAQGVGPEFKPQYRRKKKDRLEYNFVILNFLFVAQGVDPEFKPQYHKK